MTYSIVARDKQTGEFGVAVQSHYFQVSPAVPWALAGVGAVATQSRVNLSYGKLGLELLQAGYTAEQALAALTAGDPQAEVRQCAIVDAAGNVAAHTGAQCIPAARHTARSQRLRPAIRRPSSASAPSSMPQATSPRTPAPSASRPPATRSAKD